LKEEHYQFEVEQGERGRRVDVFIHDRAPDLTRSTIQRLIKEGRVSVNEKNIKSGYKIRSGDCIRIFIPEPEPLLLRPWDHPLEILYEDSSIVVINKPAGMVVHPSPGHWSETLVHALLGRSTDLSQIGSKIRPGIVHRLDKDTSGALIVAKSDRAHQELSRQFKNGAIKKMYLALVAGAMPEPEGVIDKPIGRHPVDRKKMSTRSKTGRRALTRWKVERRFSPGVSLLRVAIETGRTHQIRVHLAQLQCPVIGDPVYGGKRASAKQFADDRLEKLVTRQMLHAWRVGFTNPETGTLVTVTAPLAADMQAVIDFLSEKSAE